MDKDKDEVVCELNVDGTFEPVKNKNESFKSKKQKVKFDASYNFENEIKRSKKVKMMKFNHRRQPSVQEELEEGFEMGMDMIQGLGKYLSRWR